MTISSVCSRQVRLVGALSIAMALAPLSGCAGNRLRSEMTLQARGPVTTVANPEADGLVGRFQQAHADSRIDRGSNLLAQDFLNSGLALVEVYCDDFMYRLGSLQQKSDALTQYTGLGGTSVATVMAVAEASQPAIALTSAGFTAALASMEIFQNVYLFSPDISAVHGLVEKAMSEYTIAATAPARLAAYNYESAFATIRGAQSICEVETIRHLVNEAVKAGTVEAFSRTNIDASRKMIDDVAFAEIAGAIDSNGPLDEPQVAALYWLYRWTENPLEKAEYGKEIYKVLNGAAKTLPVTAAGARNDEFKREGTVRSALAGLSDAAQRKCQEWIVATKNRIDAAATPTPAAPAGTAFRALGGVPAPRPALPGIRIEVH